ncbi:hypothetical protein [Paenibacillus sp. IHBB 10380]|uniref:hypothetical protein n=1 Tax=Paenibacillus sp. IHBB 10380 TaxID=1566358 RepID=UPI0005CFC74C|nr:hypothetical protein [Paenibacillus sp. IHBB 10380]AJS58005.1 hypothetical protein UB51_05285 [Paenibacillus sp. IHBB 10380]
MNNKSTRSQLYFSLTFIFMLILAVAAFFFGVKVGADQMDAKYDYLKVSPAAPDFSDSYQQKDLVTFYHTVFLPYREFKSEWVTQTDAISRNEDASKNKKLLKKLNSLAEEKYDEVMKDTMYTSSPLLQDAQMNLLKSLRLFGDAVSNQSASSQKSGEHIIKELHQETYYKSATKYGLLAQKNYYAAMLKWGAKINPNIPEQYAYQKQLSLKEWDEYPLIVKNAAVSSILLNNSMYGAYDPQDMTAKIDYMLNSGSAQSLKLTNVQSVINLLNRTEAVKESDFIEKKNLYKKELLPQLPFFYE